MESSYTIAEPVTFVADALVNHRSYNMVDPTGVQKRPVKQKKQQDAGQKVSERTHAVLFGRTGSPLTNLISWLPAEPG